MGRKPACPKSGAELVDQRVAQKPGSQADKKGAPESIRQPLPEVEGNIFQV